jgi:hypothetical protein
LEHLTNPAFSSERPALQVYAGMAQGGLLTEAIGAATNRKFQGCHRLFAGFARWSDPLLSALVKGELSHATHLVTTV